MSDFIELTIDQTWDGQRLPLTQHTFLRLLCGPWDPEIWFGTAPLDGSGGSPEVEETLELYEPGLYLRLEAPFHRDPPPETAIGPTDRLWEHEVVELFIAGAPATRDPADSGQDVPGEDATPYCELEMSPWGHYLFLRLQGERNIVSGALPLPYRARRSGEVWWGEAFIPMRQLPPPPHRVNAFSMHGREARRRHLAATPVPGAEPDFHRLACFPEIVLPNV